jgi:hypothetical protein
MELLQRREFLQRSALLASAAAVLGAEPVHQEAAAASRTVSRADRLRVAVVGVRGRGMSHVNGFLKNPETTVTVICDCDEGVISNAMRTVEKVGETASFDRQRGSYSAGYIRASSLGR